MTKKKKENNCVDVVKGACACRVESLVSIDDRGQMVLPKDLRNKANIKAGDKLVVVSWEKEGRVPCICLIRSDGFTEMAKSILGPMAEYIVNKETKL